MKPRKSSAPAAPPARQLDVDAPEAPKAPANEGTDTSPRMSLSTSLSAGLPLHDSVARPGTLPPLAVAPEIPPDIDAELNNRERRIVWLMVNGASYNAARRATLTQAGNSPAPGNDDEIPQHIVAAVASIFRTVAATAGLNRQFLIAQTLALFERACCAAPVLDRKGRPTGEFKFDGATAAKCLDMLAQWSGDLYPRKGGSLAVGEVAELLRAVAGGGRPTLDQRRPARVLDHARSAQEPEN